VRIATAGSTKRRPIAKDTRIVPGESTSRGSPSKYIYKPWNTRGENRIRIANGIRMHTAQPIFDFFRTATADKK